MTADGRIRVPADLDAVTAVGDEDHSAVDSRRLDPANTPKCIPRSSCACGNNGRVVLNRAIGHGWGNGPDRSGRRRTR